MIVRRISPKAKVFNAATIFLVVAATLPEQSHAAALQRHNEAPFETELTRELHSAEEAAASRRKRSDNSYGNHVKAVLHSLEAQGYSLPDLSQSTPGEILDYIRRHYVLIKTNEGYVLGRNTRKRASDGMKLLRRADSNFQLRVRKRAMPDSNFQLRVRKDPNFQLRVRKSGGDKRSNFQLRVRRPFNDNNFQLRVRKAYPSSGNFQLRVRKAYPSSDNFQLRVRKAMAMQQGPVGLGKKSNFQLRVRKADPAAEMDGGIDMDESEMEAYQSWLNQMIEDGRLEKRDYEELGSDEDEAEDLNQGMK